MPLNVRIQKGTMPRAYWGWGYLAQRLWTGPASGQHRDLAVPCIREPPEVGVAY